MDKRYQVFVSSTYTDLRDARRRVTEILLECDCIPIGMELFPATDENAWTYIESVIRECDYYILVLGGRYGSTDEAGISFTEREYDLAVELNIPVLAFLHGSPGDIAANASELTPAGRAKLNAFRGKVQSKQLVKTWISTEDLAGKVAVSLNQAKKRTPRTGWVRANEVVPTEVYQELERLRLEVAKLKSGTALVPDTAQHLRQDDDEVAFSFAVGINLLRIEHGSPHFQYENSTISVSWNKLFSQIAPKLMVPRSETTAKELICDALRSSLSQDQLARRYQGTRDGRSYIGDIRFTINVLDIMLQFEALALVKRVEPPPIPPEPNLHSSHSPYFKIWWTLTPLGERKLIELRVAYRSNKKELQIGHEAQ